MKRIGDVLDVGTPAGEFLLYRYADPLDEVLVAGLLLQLFLKLWCKHSKKLGIARDERALSVGWTKHHGVASASADYGTAKVTLNGFHVRARLHELHAERRKARTRTVASDGEYPSKAAFV
jgi:hypothetical protein